MAFLKGNRKAYGTFIDDNMKSIGTCCLLAGLAAAALGVLSASAYLLAIGVLLHLISWFGDFWQK
jgi:hypothetical protein